jgi:hypothetical protein
MIKEEWYRNKTWNGRIDSNFEDQLKRTRNTGNKADYLQIQGCILLDNSHQNIRDVGIALLSRLFDDFPSQHSSIIVAQEKLGDYYLKQKNYERAAWFFRLVTNYCIHQQSRSGTSSMADLKLAEALLRSNQAIQLEEACQLVTNYPTILLKLNDHKFYYAELTAQVCDSIGQKEAAKKFAIEAIALSKIAKPLFARHKRDSAGNLQQLQLRTLHEISID